MGRKRVVRLCAGCGEPTPHRKRKFCDGCRDERRNEGRLRAVQRNRERAIDRRRREQSPKNRSMEREINRAKQEAVEKFGWKGSGYAIYQEGG